MIDPMREPLEGVVEINQAEIPFREGDAFFEPGVVGKILVVGAVEVIDRDTNQAKPRRKQRNISTRAPAASASRRCSRTIPLRPFKLSSKPM